MHRTILFPPLAGLALVFGAFTVPAHAQTILFSEGAGDLTIFYNASAGTWESVFRTKGNTVATGLDSPYGTPPGGVGGSQDDYTFSRLVVNVGAAPSVAVKGTSYFVTPASGTGYNIATQPDLGFRARLREDNAGIAVDQFADFRVSLVPAASTMPAGAEFILFRPADPTGFEILYETAATDFTHLWPVYGHTHWHWGFSEAGDYSLAFDLQGMGGLHGDSAVGRVTVDFTVIPEPRAYAAALGLIVLGVFLIRRMRQA